MVLEPIKDALHLIFRLKTITKDIIIVSEFIMSAIIDLILSVILLYIFLSKLAALNANISLNQNNLTDKQNQQLLMNKYMKINIFGSTGKIGTLSLNIIKKYFPDIKINLLTANKNYKKLISQIKIFNPKFVYLSNDNDAIFWKFRLHAIICYLKSIRFRCATIGMYIA